MATLAIGAPPSVRLDAAVEARSAPLLSLAPAAQSRQSSRTCRMDSALIRFRVDAELRDQAAQVCANLGTELHEVLRATVTRIARERALPYAPDGPALSPPANHVAGGDPLPYERKFWSPLKAQIDAELAVSLLVQFIADQSMRIAAAEDAGNDPAVIGQARHRRAEALRLRRTLDLSNAAEVARVIAAYRPSLPADQSDSE